MIKPETLLRKALQDDYDEPYTYTVWGSEYLRHDKRYVELVLVRTWTKWALGVDVEVDEYSTYDGTGLKRRWWYGVQFGPLSLVLTTERRVS